ncbi:MAG: two-component system nitrate/nitrite response regulator NarL [Glaciecola sp.]|jgi:two-component system nitrate/nitrite response regulator NarL
MDIQLSLIIESRIYREGISNYINAKIDMAVTYTFSSATRAIRSVDQCFADIAIIDGSIRDALLLVNTIKDTHPKMKIILLIFSSEVSFPGKCIALGAEGIVTTTDGMEDLKACILTVYSGHLCYPQEMSALFSNRVARFPKVEDLRRFERPLLTQRQTVVMQLIGNGLSNKEIARKLNIELSTVKNHVHQILQRLHVKSRLEASAQFRASPNT